MSTDRSFRWVPLIGALAALVIIWLVHQQTQQANMALQATFAQQAALQATEIALNKTMVALTPRPEVPQIGLDDLKRLMPTALAGLPDIPNTITAGASYIAGGGAQAVLKPQEYTPLELEVPVPPDRGLKLRVNLSDVVPIELELRDETLPPGAPAGMLDELAGWLSELLAR